MVLFIVNSITACNTVVVHAHGLGTVTDVHGTRTLKRYVTYRELSKITSVKLNKNGQKLARLNCCLEPRKSRLV
jgi:hypothetical protein